VEVCLHSPIYFHGIVLNQLSTGTILPAVDLFHIGTHISGLVRGGTKAVSPDRRHQSLQLHATNTPTCRTLQTCLQDVSVVLRTPLTEIFCGLPQLFQENSSI
jgi:hypothetical protein